MRALSLEGMEEEGSVGSGIEDNEGTEDASGRYSRYLLPPFDEGLSYTGQPTITRGGRRRRKPSIATHGGQSLQTFTSSISNNFKTSSKNFIWATGVLQFHSESISTRSLDRFPTTLLRISLSLSTRGERERDRFRLLERSESEGERARLLLVSRVEEACFKRRLLFRGSVCELA